MGNDCCGGPFSSPSNEKNSALDERLRSLVEQWVASLKVLHQAQSVTATKMGLRVVRGTTSILLTNAEVNVIAADNSASEQVRLIMNPPFKEVTRITDKLFLTGVGGLTVENVSYLNISVIINVTYEMPIVSRSNIFSVRIPVDDDPEDDLYLYLDNTVDIIQRAAQEGYRTVVHCVAGASRSATVVLAYLIKHQNLSLKEAFCYVQASRPCARPNMGFFRQLIQFENYVQGKNSVQFVDYAVPGGKIRVPSFYKTEYPELFVAEMKKQLRTKNEENAAIPKAIPNVEAKAKVKTTLSIKPDIKTLKEQPKVYLKDAYEEINKIRIRSCYSET